MKLYKFRPLGNETDIKRAERILTTGKFWCSLFSELNDPMEGVFLTTNASIIDDLFNAKNTYKICSFSGKKAFVNPTMWGYYANGFKGIAIELEINENEVEPITYTNELPIISDVTTEKVKTILLSKLKKWKHENEYRFLLQSNDNEHKIGKITAVYFGNPYNVYNKEQIYRNSQLLQCYACLVEQLKRDIKIVPFYRIKLENAKVKKSELEQKNNDSDGVENLS